MIHSLKNKNSEIIKVFDSYYESLCLYANKILNNITLSEDIVQDVFIKVWEKDITKSDVSIRPYLFKMVKNACISYFRKNRIDFTQIEDEIEVVDTTFEIQKITDSQLEKLHKVIDDLPDKAHAVFIRVFVYNMKYKEVAEELEVSVNTVKSQLARSLQLIKSKLSYEEFILFNCIFKIK